MSDNVKQNDLKSRSEIRGERSSIFDLARGRLSFLGSFFILLYIIIFARVVDVSVVQGALMQIRSEEVPMRVAVQNTEGMRGSIYDRNGMLLATTMQTKSLYTDARFIEDPQGVLSKLNKVIPGLPQQETLARLSSGRAHMPLARDLTPHQQHQIMMIGEPGLGMEDSHRRIYPQGALAAHLIGYTDIDGKGLAGLERSQNEFLRSGENDLVTTLDIRFQHALVKELKGAMEEFKAVAATGLIMNINTGEVLAGSSLPHYDANNAGAANDAARFNNLTLGVYELGSIFKIFSTAALLNEGAEMGTRFDARQPIKIGRFQIRDYHAEKRVMSVPEVFMHSSNIGSALMGDKVGTEKLQQYYRQLGLMDAVKFCTDEIGRPLVPSPWRPVNTMTASYGHGIAVSPLQMAAAIATSVGDGTYVQPYLVKKEKNELYDRRVFSQETAYKMRQLLRLNVVEGTGGKADVPGYMIGGKTGTAEKPDARGRYDQDKKISSFASIFPANDPEYLVLVIVDEPQGHAGTYGYATGGWVAAPAAKRVSEHMIRILGLQPYINGETDDQEFVSPLFPYIEREETIANAR